MDDDEGKVTHRPVLPKAVSRDYYGKLYLHVSTITRHVSPTVHYIYHSPECLHFLLSVLFLLLTE